MKCKFCDACKKGYFKSKPNSYICTGVKEPFVINDIEQECTEYNNPKTTYEKIKEINNHDLEELYLTVENGCASDIELSNIGKLVEYIYGAHLFIEAQKKLKEENMLLRDIIIEKEKESYNR